MHHQAFCVDSNLPFEAWTCITIIGSAFLLRCLSNACCWKVVGYICSIFEKLQFKAGADHMRGCTQFRRLKRGLLDFIFIHNRTCSVPPVKILSTTSTGNKIQNLSLKLAFDCRVLIVSTLILFLLSVEILSL